MSYLKHSNENLWLSFISREHKIPCGHTVSKQRLAELANLFKNNQTIIIEHDAIGDLSQNKSLSLGSYYPQKTIYIRSYLKAYGSDLSISVLSATKKIIEQIQNNRSMSISPTSRLLQHALAFLITDSDAQKQLELAKKTYEKRYNQLINALKVGNTDRLKRKWGLNLWLPVPTGKYQYALAVLSAQGIHVAPGSCYSMNGISNISISTSLLEKQEQIDKVANAINLALSRQNTPRPLGVSDKFVDVNRFFRPRNIRNI